MSILISFVVLFGISTEVYLILFLIAIPNFLFWKWLYSKYITDNKIRNIIIGLSTIAFTPIIYFGLIAGLIFYISHEPSKDFDKKEWAENKEGRFEMADDIIENKILIGKDTLQVKELLGPPTWQDSVNKHWDYNLGMGKSGFGVMFHGLSVAFDKNKVLNVVHNRAKD